MRALHRQEYLPRLERICSSNWKVYIPRLEYELSNYGKPRGAPLLYLSHKVRRESTIANRGDKGLTSPPIIKLIAGWITFDYPLSALWIQGTHSTPGNDNPPKLIR